MLTSTSAAQQSRSAGKAARSPSSPSLSRSKIAGTLNRQGILKELVVEQHSGTAAIDKMVVAACKKGLFIHNPPPEATDPGGDYKVRIEARFENYASTDGEHWEFKTYMGLALL